jgi:hypothetical protein
MRAMLAKAQDVLQQDLAGWSPLETDHAVLSGPLQPQCLQVRRFPREHDGLFVQSAGLPVAFMLGLRTQSVKSCTDFPIGLKSPDRAKGLAPMV